MKKCKFEIGDLVIGNKFANDYYSITRYGTTWKVVGITDEDYIIVENPKYDNWGRYDVRASCFDLVKAAKPSSEVEEGVIRIYRKGRTVTAFNPVTGEKAEARCNPEDTFNFYTGAQVAFHRLLQRGGQCIPEKELEELCRGSLKVGDTVRVIKGASYSQSIDKVVSLCKDHPEWIARFAYKVPFKVDGKPYKVLAMNDSFVYITKACAVDSGACWVLLKEAVVKEV